jgi:hypothetical protein
VARLAPTVFLPALAAAALAGAPHPVRAQARPAEIAAEFTKFKSKTKTRHGVVWTKFRDVRSVPAPAAEPAAYAGDYAVDEFGFTLALRVDPSGRLAGEGSEPTWDGGSLRRFTLRGVTVHGAVLTATKVFEDGTTRPLEGAFLHRTDRDAPDDPGTTSFGLGVVGVDVQLDGLRLDRLFYRRVR